MNDILSQILINKANELKKLDKNIIPIKRQNHYDFFQALKSDKISIIAEVKFKSPSEGLIYKNIDPLKIALEYQNAGADAISIISDSKFFNGDVKYIQEIRNYINIPILQKDFIIDSSQIISLLRIRAHFLVMIRNLDSHLQSWIKLYQSHHHHHNMDLVPLRDQTLLPSMNNLGIS